MTSSFLSHSSIFTFCEKRIIFASPEFHSPLGERERTYLKDMISILNPNELSLIQKVLQDQDFNGGNYKKQEYTERIHRILSLLRYFNDDDKEQTYGEKTRENIRFLQRNLGITSDGVFGNQTALRLQEMVARELHEKAKVRTRLTNLTANIDKDQKKVLVKKETTKREKIRATITTEQKKFIQRISYFSLSENKTEFSEHAQEIRKGLEILGYDVSNVSVQNIREIPYQKKQDRPQIIKKAQEDFGVTPDGWPGNIFWSAVVREYKIGQEDYQKVTPLSTTRREVVRGETEPEKAESEKNTFIQTIRNNNGNDIADFIIALKTEKKIDIRQIHQGSFEKTIGEQTRYFYREGNDIYFSKASTIFEQLPSHPQVGNTTNRLYGKLGTQELFIATPEAELIEVTALNTSRFYQEKGGEKRRFDISGNIIRENLGYSSDGFRIGDSS